MAIGLEICGVRRLKIIYCTDIRFEPALLQFQKYYKTMIIKWEKMQLEHFGNHYCLHVTSQRSRFLHFD